jgi:penicillin-binding protein 2
MDYPVLEQRMYYTVVGDLDEKEAVDLRGKLGNSTWAIVRPGSRRNYLRHETLCHLLGRTIRTPGSQSKTFRILDDDYLPGELQGLEGLEYSCDDILRGNRGWIELGKKTTIRQQPADGKDVVLTIDVELQEYIQNRLKKQVKSLPYATGGAVVVMDIRNSEILALASVPTFDPSEFRQRYEELRHDRKYLPLTNRAIQMRYPPGSIVKPLVGAWAMTKGKITESTSFYCKGYLSENLKAFKCWLPSGHQEENFTEAIKNSCDVYFYHVGELLTAEGMSEFYQHLGVDEQTPLAVREDGSSGISTIRGRVPTQKWFISHHGRGMSVGDARNLAIGQGDLEISPLQAAIMTEAIISGVYQPPRIFTSEEKSVGKKLGISPYALRLARQGMYQVIHDTDGTAHKFAYDSNYSAAGKTGSAQAIPRPIRWEMSYVDPNSGKLVKEIVSNREDFYSKTPVSQKAINYKTIESFPQLRDEDKFDPGSNREKTMSHGWFVGFAPVDKPKIVCIVFIEYGLAGGSGAGPVFKDVMLKCKEFGYF